MKDLFDLSDTSNALFVDGGDTGSGIDVSVVDGSWSDLGIGGGYHSYRLGAAVVNVAEDLEVDIVLA